MVKRPGESLPLEGESLKDRAHANEHESDDEVGEFEDTFEDEFEDDEEIFEAGEDGGPDEEPDGANKGDSMDVDQDTFIPGRSKLEANQNLSPDLSTYNTLHTLDSRWPCLSFDLIKDPSNPPQLKYPLTIYTVAGTQAEAGKESQNELVVSKMSGLSKNSDPDHDSSDESDDDEAETEPTLESKSIPLPSTTNRIRAFETSHGNSSQIVAAMLENGNVIIYDISVHVKAFNTPGAVVTPQDNKPLSTIRTHGRTEGYALDWAPNKFHPMGTLLTGDNAGQIYLTKRTEGGGWATDSRPFSGHEGSVEEIQWSPSESTVFASASSDGTVKLWDTRSKSRKAQRSVKVSNTDVNVMSWSKQTDFLLATGDDAGGWAVWDLRQWANVSAENNAFATFNFHKAPITSIEWNPRDDSTVLVGSADSTVSLWDLSVELDDEESQDTQGVPDVPPQLLFVHYMEDVKEAHWSEKHPGVVMATGAKGFSIFKTISV